MKLLPSFFLASLVGSVVIAMKEKQEAVGDRRVSRNEVNHVQDTGSSMAENKDPLSNSPENIIKDVLFDTDGANDEDKKGKN